MTILGRGAEIRQLTDDCLAGRFAVVTHEPGLGASTLLAAGVVPALRTAVSLSVYFAEWQGRGFSIDLKEAIAQAVREQADASFYAQGEPLEDMLLRVKRTTGRQVALVLDQFEEYLRFHTGTYVSDEFEAELAHAVNARNAHFVVALQEHGVPAFERLSHLIPNLMGHRLQLQPLRREAADEVVRAMAAEQCLPIDDSVVLAFVQAPAAAVRDGVHPWLLNRGVFRLLEAAAARKPAAASAPVLEALGGADKLILRCLDPEIEKLNISHKQVLFQWCDALISKDGYRLSASEKALTDYAGRLNRFGTTLLPILLGDGILRVVDMGGTPRYELSRESLTIILKDWWTRQESAMIAKRRAQFRVRSMTIAMGAILLLYFVWLYLTWK